MHTTVRSAATPVPQSRPVQQRSTAARVDFLRTAVGVLIVMVVSRVHQLIPVLPALRPALLLSLAALGYALTSPSAVTRTNILRLWWVRAVMVLVVQGVLSALFGLSIGAAGKFVLLVYSTILLLFFLTVASVRTTKDLMVFISAYLIGLAALAYQTNFLFQLSNTSGLARLDSLFAFDANDVGLIFATGVPLAAALIPVWKGYRKPLILLLLVAIGIGIARTGSRGAFLTLVVSGGAMLVFNRGVAVLHRVLFAAAVTGALIVAAPPGYFQQMQTISDPKDDYNWSSPYGRREIAKRGIGYMKAYPVFGLGINNFRKAECTISPRMELELSGTGNAHCAAPHNTWIQVGAELGFPGLLAWVVMLMLPMAKLFHLSRKLPLRWRKGDLEQRFLFACAGALPISILGFMIGSTFLSFAWVDIPYLLVSFAGCTWMLATKRLSDDRELKRAEFRARAQAGGARA